MEIEFALDESDLFAVSMHQADHSPMLKGRYKRRLIGYPSGFGLLSLGFYMMLPQTQIYLWFLGLAVLSVFLYPVYTHMLTRWQVRRAISLRTPPQTFEKRTMHATDEGLLVVTEDGESRVNWAFIKNVILLPTHLLIFLADNTPVIIPKNKLPDDEYNQFTEVVFEHIPESKRKLTG